MFTREARLSWRPSPLQGVPPKHRAWVWSEVSGAAAKQKEQMNNYYEAMVHMGEACSVASHQIELVSASGPCAACEHWAISRGQPDALCMLVRALIGSHRPLLAARAPSFPMRCLPEAGRQSAPLPWRSGAAQGTILESCPHSPTCNGMSDMKADIRPTPAAHCAGPATQWPQPKAFAGAC